VKVALYLERVAADRTDMEASSVTKSRLIGAVLVENGLITPDQLALALDLQAKSGERLGEIVVAEFGVSRLDLAGVLAEQWSGIEAVPKGVSGTSPPPDAFKPLTPDEVQIRRPIGEIFVELGFITADQLEAALAAQSQSGARIGEILVEQGSLTRLDLASALVEQWSALQKIGRPEPAAPGDSELPQGVAPLRPISDVGAGTIERDGVEALDERLRLVESTTSAALSQEDLDQTQIDLRAAIEALEARLETALETSGTQDLGEALRALLARVDALEDAPVEGDLAALRDEIESLRTERVEAQRFAELVEAVERLEQGTTRVEDVEALAAEIGALTARMEALSDLGELRDRVDAAAAQTEAVESGLLELSTRLEPLDALESRLGEPGSIVDRSEADRLAGRIELLEAKNRQEAEHLDRLAASIEAREAMSPALDAMRARLDELGRLVEEGVGVGVVDDLRARVEEISSSLEARSLQGGTELLAERLAAAESRLELMETFDGRLSALAEELERGPEGEASMVEVAALREELGRVAASVAAEKGSLAEVLASRGSLEEELVGIRSRLDELAASPSEDVALRERVEVVVSRLDELGRLEASVGNLREMVASVDTVRSADALAVGERLAGVESSLRSMAGMESSLREEVTRAWEEGAASLAERLAAAESQLELLVETHGQQLETLTAELEGRPADETLTVEVAALREELARLATSTATERSALAEALVARGPLEEELSGIRSRLDDLAASPAEAMSPALDAMRARLDELGRLVEEGVGVGVVDDLRARVEEISSSLEARSLQGGTELLAERLAAAESRLELMETFDGRLSALAEELERGPEGEASMVEVAALREELGRVAASVAAEKGSLAEVLASRGSLEEELVGIRSRLDELAASPSEDVALRERVEVVVSRLDELGRLEASVGNLREMVASVDTVRSADALAVGERLAGVESSLRSMAGMESSLREEVTRAWEEGAASLAERLAAAESQLELLVETHGQQLETLTAELEGRPGTDALAALDEIRARMGTLAERTAIDDLDRRISEVAEQSARIASDARAAIDGPLEELGTRVEGLSGALGTRINELADRIGGLVDREEIDSATAAHVGWLQSELASIREAGAAHAASSQAALREIEQRLETDVRDVRAALDASLTAVRSEASEERQEFRLLMGAHDNARDEQRASLQRLDEEHATTVASVTRVEQMLAEGLSALSARFTEELAAVRGAVEQEAAGVHGEVASLQARVDEIHALRDTDARASRSLAQRLEALANAHESDFEASRSAQGDLADRFEDLSDELNGRVAAAHAPVERLEKKLEKLRALRDEDSATARIASAELEARLDSLVSRCEAADGASVEARDELRGEIERLASSMGWRLEKIEEVLAADDSATLRSAVGDLERRLEGQIAVGETQAQATERALRKGLASLGERLVDTESAYVEAGNKFRRAIERLGAAVVEADARIADRIPTSPLEGCVAFAPTSDGYRLIELPGAPPEVGSTLELEGCDAPLVVTRYGLSPLPLDRRPCAYLDHVEPRE
jgi:chromosome segregation protein